MVTHRKPSRPHIHEKPTPKNKPIDNNSAKDQGGTARDWPNELGAIVRSPLLGEGYYSDPSGLPGGGLSVSEWRKKKKKKRKQNAQRAKKIMATYKLARIYEKIATIINEKLKKTSKSLTPFEQKEVDNELAYPSREEYAEDLGKKIKLSVKKALIESVPQDVLNDLSSYNQDVGEVDVDHYDYYSEIVFRIPPIINKPWENLTFEKDEYGNEYVQPMIESELDKIYIKAYYAIVENFWLVLDNEDSDYIIRRINFIGEHDSTPQTGFYYILRVY